MSAVLLQLEGVHTHIGAYHILHGVDLRVRLGEVTLLLGRNGVGKTTTLRTIMGLWQASNGRISWEGADITHRPTPLMADLGVAYVPENMGVFSDLSVEENLLLAARQVRRAEQFDAHRLQRILDWFPALKTFWRHPAGKLSGGQKQMLAVARAIIEPRRLLIVDEPSKGLAPAIVDNMVQAFVELKREGVTLLLVEQNLQVARALGDQVAVMDDGRIVHASSLPDLMADEALQQRLLGLAL
jgi:branched-chain amino acid transport system ATP-binding protein